MKRGWAGGEPVGKSSSAAAAAGARASARLGVTATRQENPENHRVTITLVTNVLNRFGKKPQVMSQNFIAPTAHLPREIVHAEHCERRASGGAVELF